MLYLLLLFSFYSFGNSSQLEYIKIDGPVYKSFILSPGRYKVTLYGAQGGFSYYDGGWANSGGRGAKVSGYINVKGHDQEFHAFVGGMGSSRKTGLAEGGYNGGGTSGWNIKWKAHTFHNKQYDNGPGGGGGATDLRIDTTDISDRIMVAGGGSGACSISPGGSGGDLNGYNTWGVSTRTTQTLGIPNGYGASGSSAKHFPSSGGGGGYMGGSAGTPSEVESNSPIADGGSSYISGYSGCTSHSKITFDSGEMIAGNHEGNGLLQIDIEYKCPSHCSSCTGENECYSCDSSYRLFNGQCYLTCPPRSIDRGFYCEKCDDSCSECSGEITNCTSCADYYFKYNDKCLSKCPDGTYEYESKCMNECEVGTYPRGSSCYECSVNCKNCIDNSEKCTDCPDGKYLFNSRCVGSCPEKYVKEGNKCISECGFNQYLYHDICYNNCPKGTYQRDIYCDNCDSSCAQCNGSPTTCTACSDDKYLFNYQCIDNCLGDLYYYDNQCLVRCPSKTFTIGKKCVDDCPDGTFGINKMCEECDSSCYACENTPDTCTKCKDNSYLYNNQCLSKCVEGTFAYQNVCVEECPTGTIQKDDICQNSTDYYYDKTEKVTKKNKLKLSKGAEIAVLVTGIIFFAGMLTAVIILSIFECC